MKQRTMKECKKKDCKRYENYTRWQCSDHNLQVCIQCKNAYVSQFERKDKEATK